MLFFDKASEMALQIVKLKTEQKKIFKYTNAKIEVGGREKEG